MNIGQRIRALRKQRKLTLKGLAQCSGVTLRGIHAIETGQVRSPRLDTLALIARGLEMTVVEMLTGVEC